MKRKKVRNSSGFVNAILAFTVALAFVMSGQVVFADIRNPMDGALLVDNNPNIIMTDNISPDYRSTNRDIRSLSDARPVQSGTVREGQTVDRPAICIDTNDNIKETVESSGSSVDWWPMFHHDLNNSGYSTSTAPDTNNVLWSYDAGAGAKSPSVVDGKVFASTYAHWNEQGKVYCLNESDGSRIWTYTIPAGTAYASPAVDDGRVFIASWMGYVYCLNESDGVLIWTFYTGDGHLIASSPAVFDGKVYIGSHDRKIYCLDASDGSIVWEHYTSGAATSPAIVDGKVYVASRGGKVYCLNAQNGSLIWESTVVGWIDSSPTVVDGQVYIASNNAGGLFCLNASDGSLIWNNSISGAWYSCPAVAYGKVFVGIHTTFYAFDILDGSLIWEQNYYPYIVMSSPAVADGKIYFGHTNKVFCFDESDGSEIWTYTTDGGECSYPAIANGKVFYGSDDGNIYCFGPPDHDIGVTSIDSPVSGSGNIFTPEITVRNLGCSNETNIPVSIEIARWEPPHAIVEYKEKVFIDINAGETVNVVFSVDWIPKNLYGVPCSTRYRVIACSYLRGDVNPGNDCVTVNITLDYLHDVGVKEITEPSSSGRLDDGEWIHFDDGVNTGGVGSTGGGTFEAGIKITSAELEGYNNWQITAVKFYHYTYGQHSGNIKIYEDWISTHPGALISSEPYTVTSTGWSVIPLSNPVLLDADEDVWVSVEITHEAGERPIGIDDGPVVDGKGDWYYHENLGWVELQDYNIDRNWNLWAWVEEVDRWPPGTYPVEGVVKNYGSFNESNFNVDATIFEVTDDDKVFYHDDCTVTEIMYLRDEITVTFSNVTFREFDGGIYRLEITTELIDGNPWNDKRTKAFGIAGISDTIPPDITPDKQKIGLMETKFTATVCDPDPSSGIDRVEFYLNGKPEKTFTEDSHVTNKSYEWNWTGFGNPNVTVIAYDNAGNSNAKSISTPYSQHQSTSLQFIERFIQRFPILERILSIFFRV